MNTKALRANFLLLLAAFIWGASFVAQKTGLDHMGPFTFNGFRCFLGVAVLLPVLAVRRRLALRAPPPHPRSDPRALWIGGALCGLLLFLATSLQQLGMIHTTAGKSGFLTALYVLIVPFLSVLVGKPVRRILWLCIALAVAGLYLLCIDESLSVNRGDLLEFACAVVFSFHILAIDRFSPRVDGIALSAVQFLVCGLVSLPVIYSLETPAFSQFVSGWRPFLYSGILSCGVAYTLQIVAQKDTSPTIASLIMCLESLFALLSGWLLIREPVAPREWAGAAILLLALFLAQIPAKKPEAVR